MRKYILLIAAIILTAFVGWYFGYINGAKNQLYFDAAARASLYEKGVIMDDEGRKEMIGLFLSKQRCLLSSGFNFDTFTVNHPIHLGILDYYEKNIERVCSNNKCVCERGAKK